MQARSHFTRNQIQSARLRTKIEKIKLFTLKEFSYGC